MTIQQLEYIVALDKYRHFVKAAESVHVSQPNLTMQIKKLEDEVGVKIFNRDKSPVNPTPIGEIFLSKARQILNHVMDLKEFVSVEKNTIEGEFAVGIIPTVAPYLLPLFLPSFLEKHPKTKLSIKEMQTSEIISNINMNKIDLGILATPLSEKNIREVPVFNEPFLIYVNDLKTNFSKKNIDPSTVSDGNLLLLDEGHCFREQALEICSNTGNSGAFNFEFSSGSIEALIGLVDKGLGHTLIPQLASIGKNENNIRNFKGATPTREISIVANNNFTKDKLIDSLYDSITSSLPTDIQKIKKYFRVEWK